jgi:hypothetical protein
MAFEQILFNKLNKSDGKEDEQQLPIVIKVLRGGKCFHGFTATY